MLGNLWRGFWGEFWLWVCGDLVGDFWGFAIGVAMDFLGSVWMNRPPGPSGMPPENML